ncbi:MAG: PilW family protein [Hahellaceae bacterium]|nr:PilW family protein [Hahellaceae bacterium]MCP5170036.1 PilW family protein [Hahellaceae bacterium]
MIHLKLAAPFRNFQVGLTLVELMVSLALSSILIAGVFSLYLDSRGTDRMGTALARIQESGRFASEFMAKDIRMAGYQGCADPNSVGMNIIAKNPPTLNFANSAMRGYEVTNTSWANGTEFDNTSIETRALIGSDVIAIQRATSADTQLTGNMGVVNANIQITDNALGLKAQDIILISDCEFADLFRATNVSSSGTKVTIAHSNSQNTSNFLSKAYDTSAKILRFSSTVYFVADTGRDDLAGNPIYALYRQSDNLLNSAYSAASFDIQELVEGVENMQILYGERLASGNVRFVPAGTAGLDMTQVVSVRIGLLISSPEDVQQTTDKLTYAMPGEDIKPASSAGATVTHAEDRRIRRTFLATINLRNR